MVYVIITQFLLQTALIVGLAIMWQPIISGVAFETTLYDEATLEELAFRDALFQFGMIIGAIAMAFNIVWLYNRIKIENATI